MSNFFDFRNFGKKGLKILEISKNNYRTRGNFHSNNLDNQPKKSKVKIMTRREFIAISDKMKVLAAEQMDEDAAVSSCKIVMQTKDGESFDFATIRRDGARIVEGSRGGILAPDCIIFVVGNDGATVCVPYTEVTTLYSKSERSEDAEKNQN